MSIRRVFVPLVLLCLAVLSLALAACGGGASKSSAGQDDEQKLVKFAKCMREHGMNVATPSGSSGEIRITGSAKAGNPEQLEAAQNACKRYQPSPPKQNLSPAEKAARADAALKFAQCMRSHGVDVPNPETGGGFVKIRAKRGAGGLNFSAPKFQAAQKACQGLLPGPPGGAKGGGPASS
ncbi:MAG: hypothetical protein ACYDHT_12030, partial [Solirubrobacteraceae bacterium]